MQSTRLDWTELGMAANEVRQAVRNYSVNCPAGVHEVQIVANVYDPSDNNLANNQDENHPLLHASNNDLDGDTVPNGQDNCPLNSNPGQADADGDHRRIP